MTMMPSDYTSLTNDVRLRSSLRRLFTGQIDEILGELFQNSQRAGASTVEIHTTTNAFTIADDGHGLLGGTNGFWRLLRIAESYFASPEVVDQDPMGLGINSLLAHEAVQTVMFTSNGLQLCIETSRWWNEPEYYSTWVERLVAVEQDSPGLRIDITCSETLVEQLHKALKSVEGYPSHFQRKWSPAQGYDGLLSIICDGTSVVTTLPKWTQPKVPFLKTSYMGQDLIIGGAWDKESGYNSWDRGSGVINWYGQLIGTPRGIGAFSYILTVRSGRCVNPLSPSRRGLIDDTAFSALEQFIRDSIFQYIAGLEHREQITPSLVQAAYSLDIVRAAREIPYIVVAPWTGLDDECNVSALEATGKDQLATIVDLPLLVHPSVRVDSRTAVVNETYTCWDPVMTTDQAEQAASSPWRPFEYGIDAFIADLKAADLAPYHLVCGPRAGVTIHYLYWRPGTARDDAFNERGRWGLSASVESEPESWFDVTQTVFAFNESACTDPKDVDWVVGTKDPQHFLANEVWYGFGPSEDEDYWPQEEEYREACMAWLRAIIGNCVPFNFCYSQLQNMLPTHNSPITRLSYHRSRKKGAHRPPTAITVWNAAGEKRRLKLVG